MPRPIPTQVVHFTHISNLAGIVTNGLVCDAHSARHLVTEAGEPSIKAKRRRRDVTVGPGGVVADYVPFYFASRSPMMYSLHRGNVPTFTGHSHDLIYLVTSVETLITQGHDLVFTDRNATLKTSRQSSGIDDLDCLIDWHLMRARMWNDTPDDPDRKERRMAECLVHDRVDFKAFEQIVVHDRDRAHNVEIILRNVGASIPHIGVHPRTYF